MVPASAQEYEATQVIAVEIGKPLPVLQARLLEDGQQYRKARLLVLLHTHPLGTVDVVFDDGTLYPAVYAQRIWAALRSEILDHLKQDGMPAIPRLSSDGIATSASLACLYTRERALDHAPFVSVILCTRDRPALLDRVLRALLAQEYAHYEVIVIDNAPRTSATADVIRQRFANMPRLRYVLERRPGLSTARNRGIMEARGSILAFTDDDTVPTPTWLAALVAAFRGAENVTCVTGLAFPLAMDTHAQYWFEEFGGFNKGYTRQVFSLATRHEQPPLFPYTAGRFGTGANMAFTATFLRSMGGFDASLGVGTESGGGEDLDAFFRVIAAGCTLVYEPDALLYHEHRRDYDALRNQIANAGRGLVAYLLKTIDDDRSRVFDILRRVPYGLYFVLSPTSSKNHHRSHTYPRELALLELRGMARGPVAYLRARWRKRVTGGLRPFERTVPSVAPKVTLQLPAIRG